jgi:S-formylglutathione hydrolase FrmB
MIDAGLPTPGGRRWSAACLSWTQFVLGLAAVAVLLASCSSNSKGSQRRATPNSVEPVAVRAPVVPKHAPRSPLTLVSRTQLSPRLFELTLHTTTLDPETTKVRVLLPSDYATSGRRYPVLYLLHGGLTDASTWTALGAEQATAGLPVIVVMPSEGAYGYYTDWFNKGQFGPPQWDTYNANQLIPWIDANYRTIPDRSARATAGFSLGGGGAVILAAAHPDLIGAAGSFSGAVDITTPTSRGTVDPVAPLIWGSYDTQEVRWRGNNATDLAANLTNTDVALYTGDGDPNIPAGLTNLERMIKEETANLHDRLTALGIPHLYDAYGAGTHSPDFFERDLKQWLPRMVHFFSLHHALPTSFTYASTKPNYSVYDWNVSLQRRAVEFSALDVASAARFSVVGSGNATVVTGALYEPNRKYAVTISDATNSKTKSITTDADGRLTLTLHLGPPNPAQQYTIAAAAHARTTAPNQPVTSHPPFLVRGSGSTFYRTRISVARG